MSLPTPTEFPIAEAMKAQAALRNAASLPVENFPLPAVIGMLSDEIQACREKGKTDAEIADLISHASAIRVTPDQLAEHYASEGDRGRP